MYKKYNSKFKSQASTFPSASLPAAPKTRLSDIAERLLPFLIIAFAFVWLWK